MVSSLHAFQLGHSTIIFPLPKVYSKFNEVYVLWVNLPKPCHLPHVSLLVAFELTCKGVIGMKCVLSQGCLLQFWQKSITNSKLL
jgi:hypothetical protein